MLAATAELNRPPFDLVEAEQELVGGFNTEYSSIRFGLFFLAEFMNTITMSAVIVTLFFGGYLLPFEPVILSTFPGLDGTIFLGALQILTLLLKAGFFAFLFIWVRWTLPRFKYQQLMTLGWKYLLPIALVNLRWYWTRPPIPWMWDRHQAGGQIVDQNIHLVDVAQGLAGEIETVYAAYSRRQVNFEPGFDNWDGYALTMRFKNGAVGNCAGTYGLFPEIQIGPAADFALRDRLVRVTDKGAAHYTPSGVEEWANSGPFHAGVDQAFINAVATGDRSHVTATLRDGLRSTAATLAANHSAETGEVVNLDQFIQERAGTS